ncbi:XRE family transcriptional regulator [Cutibacterium avidum ATCC 25577]|uniref:XRE family transcriptional regulator n=1 Tax=Cutibacterium avidum ATCC 25577 TaxID=997355 RepID=G4CZ23_9ACTN|nr:XRE family transcriptional regulator [Cutibacterium avidum ATCC 25577]
MSSAFEGLERHTMAESLAQQTISDPRGVSRPTHCRFRRQAR